MNRSARLGSLALAAMIAVTALLGPASAAHHRHRHHRQVRLSDAPAFGAYTPADDRVYGGAYYGFFTSPLYGRYQRY